jgi:hypothetical protein
VAGRYEEQGDRVLDVNCGVRVHRLVVPLTGLGVGEEKGLTVKRSSHHEERARACFASFHLDHPNFPRRGGSFPPSCTAALLHFCCNRRNSGVLRASLETPWAGLRGTLKVPESRAFWRRRTPRRILGFEAIRPAHGGSG